MRRTQRAFTLAEVSVTLFIIGILLAMSLPMLKNFIDRTDDELVQSQLLQAIELAREQALLRGVSMVLCQSSDHWRCEKNAGNSLIIFINEDEDGLLHTKDLRVAVVQMKSHHGKLYWRSFPFYRDYVLFSAEILQTDNGTFWYCHAGASHPVWAVMLNKTGRARVMYPNKNGEINESHGEPLTC